MKILFGIVLILQGFLGLCQSNYPTKFVIVEIDRERTKDNHRTQISYWIVPIDSITNLINSFNPLYLNGFSMNNMSECCNSGILTIFYYTDSTNYNFNLSYLKDRDKLTNLLISNRKKVLSIKKKWGNGIIEKIKVYLTPIQGNFCICKIDEHGVKKINYGGNILIPLSNFIYLDDFWEHNNVVQFKYFDYSILRFLDLHSML